MTRPVVSEDMPAAQRDQLHQVVVAAHRDMRVDVRDGDQPGNVRGTTPHLAFIAGQTARKALGLPVWADITEWAEASARSRPDRAVRYIAEGLLPQGWEP